MVSVILATRNRRGWLPRALASVLDQDSPDWELVVLDNGDDRVADLMPADPRVRYFHEPASGPADAFQRALDHATGDIIIPLADDDRLAPETVRRITEGIGDAEWGYARTAYQVDGVTQFLLGEPWSLERLRADYYLGGAVFWRRELSDRLGGFDDAYDGAADYDLYLRFGEDSEPVFLTDVLYLYNDWEGTDSRVRPENQRAKAEMVRRRGPQPRVSIVTPWIGHTELLDGYLRVVNGADEVVVIDNGGAPVAGLSAAGVEVLATEQPLGFSESNNVGAQHTTGDIVVFLNNDVDGDGRWLRGVRRDVGPGGLYGPSVGVQTLDGVAIPYVEGWCLAARRDVFEALEWWDSHAFPLPYWEDVDLSIRAARAGFGLFRTPWRVHHMGGVSTGSVPGAWDGFEQQRATVEARLRMVRA